MLALAAQDSRVIDVRDGTPESTLRSTTLGYFHAQAEDRLSRSVGLPGRGRCGAAVLAIPGRCHFALATVTHQVGVFFAAIVTTYTFELRAAGGD